jgi:hypothetical protein
MLCSSKEREKYYKHKKKAIDTAQNLTAWQEVYNKDNKQLLDSMPSKLYYCLIIDIMDQAKTQLPHLTRYPKDFTPDCLFGVRLSGLILQGHFIDGLFDYSQWKKGADINASQIIEMLLALQKKYHPLPIFGPHAVLYIQSDNAGDNKNHVMISLMAALVESGLFGKVKDNKMRPGHTHEANDEILYLFKFELS